MNSPQPAWSTYEEVARYVLNKIRSEFGIDEFEGKQKIAGKRSRAWHEIDCKGVCKGAETFFIVECRRYTTSRQSQGKIGELAYRIIDTGAAGGILVSPLGVQEGAKKIAKAENIISILLHPDSTPDAYVARFLAELRAGFRDSTRITDSVHISVVDSE